MTIRVQPHEGVFLSINSSVPSLEAKSVEAIDLDLTYHGREIPEAYEALLLDALKWDKARSVRGDELDASWRIWTPLLRWLDESGEVVPRGYAYGELILLILASCRWGGVNEKGRFERTRGVGGVHRVVSA